MSTAPAASPIQREPELLGQTVVVISGSAGIGLETARRDIEAHLFLPLQVARNATKRVRPGGTLLFMGGTGGRRTTPGFTLISALTAAMPAMTKNLALELAPIRFESHRLRHKKANFDEAASKVFLQGLSN